jgi:hypothetical protein
MAENAYHFVDRWRVEADVKEVAGILEDALSLPRWWSSVYFDVEEIESVEKNGISKLISLFVPWRLCVRMLFGTHYISPEDAEPQRKTAK